MTREEFRQYVHPRERSRLILAMVFAVPLILIVVAFVIASLGALLLLIGLGAGFVWIIMEVFYAKFVANAIRVSETNYPRLNDLLDEMKKQIGTSKKVDVFVYQQGEFNAYFKRFFARRAIFVNSELLEQGVSDDELRWIIGRFIGRIRSRELKNVAGWILTVAKKLVVFNLFLMPYERATSYTGDRVALACIDGDVSTAVSAMNKLLVGRSLGYSVNPAGIVEQHRDVKGSFFAFLARLSSDMPHTLTRYVDLIGFAQQQFPQEFQKFVAENPSFQSISRTVTAQAT
jgi:hypothetical protein